MKIGIVTQYTKETVNYGNVLQTFALNRYLRNLFPDYKIETLLLKDDYEIGKVKTSYAVALIRKLLTLFTCKKAKNIKVKKQTDSERKKGFVIFADSHIVFSQEVTKESDLQKSSYDVLVVGSDVVWAQIRNNYNRVKFLCFPGSEHAIKFSYAASFGRDYIPFENRRAIVKALKHFKGISVREKSSIKLLENMGIKNVMHVCDPTLLLTKDIWREIINKPMIMEDSQDKNIISKRFIFCFLLNANEWQLKMVKKIKNDLDCAVINVTNGYINEEKFSINNIFDEIYSVIAPDEWLWFIDNAEMVITDSFHCMIFSIIFQKKFFVLERQYSSNINNRMIDFLSMIQCLDKYIKNDENKEFLLGKYEWDYNIINSIVINLKDLSIDFIKKMIDK